MSDPALKEAVELADALVNELLPDQGSGGSWAFALALKLQASVSSQSATLEAMASAMERIENQCPATCETSPAHSMADIARTTLNQYRQGGL